MKLPVMRLRLVFRAIDEMHFQEYTGSTFRGGFGKALRASACKIGAEKCHGCPHLGECPYAVIFEGIKPAVNNEGKPCTVSITNPFVMEPLPIGLHMLPATSEFSCKLVLFGDACRYYKEAVQACAFAGLGGLGKVMARAMLTSVYLEGSEDQGDESLLASANDKLPDYGSVLPNFEVPGEAIDYARVRAVRIILKTPLRICYNRRPINQRDLSADDFLGAVLRRVKELGEHYTSMPECAQFKAWLAQGLEVLSAFSEEELKIALTNRKLEWFDWTRYSNRQKVEMSLGGVMGSFELHGFLGPYMPFILMASILHAGKSTVMGLGHFQVEIL